VFRNSGYVFAGLSIAAIAAFWPSYLSRPFATIDGTTHVHAAAMASWCALLVAQAFLIRAGKVRWHRAIGKLSYAVAPLIVVAALRLTQVRIQAVPAPELRDAARDFYLPLSATLLFAVSYALAMAFRHRAALHARFMIGTALSFIDPVGARIMIFHVRSIGAPLMQPITFGIIDAWLLFAIWRERRASRGRAAFPVLLAVFAVAHLLWFTLATSDAWVRVVERFGSLWLA
jgi:hypothetical protein